MLHELHSFKCNRSHPKKHTCTPRVQGLTLVFFEPCNSAQQDGTSTPPAPPSTKKKKKRNQRRRSRQKGFGRRKEHREEREKMGQRVHFAFPLFHRGAPIDGSSAQIRQQMLALSVSFSCGKKKGSKGPPLAPLLFISSSLLPARLLAAPLHRPRKTALPLRIGGTRADN